MNATITEAWRLKLDIQLPDNISDVTTTVDSSNANLKGIVPLRVNDSGNLDENGDIIRLTSADNATIGNGPNSKNGPGGVSYKPNGTKLELAFPTFTIKGKATTPGELNFGVRTKGQAGTHNNDQNFLTLGATVKVGFLKPNVRARCTPRPDASAPLDERAARLAVIKVEDEQVAQNTGIEVKAAQNAKAGLPTELTATVTPANAAGSVVFTSGSLKSAAIPVTNGVATTQMTFPEAGSYPVTAVFVPTSPQQFNASSAATDVVVEGQDPNLTLQAPDTVDAADGAVEVTAKVDQKAEGTVEFSLADGSVVTQKIADGEATASLPLGDAPDETELKAVFIPAAGSPFKTAEATKSLTIKPAPTTFMTLEAQNQQVPRVGEESVITAFIIPADGTTDAKGSVTFSFEGEEQTVEVKDNTAAFSITPKTAGEKTVDALFIPADKTQSEASSSLTFKVAEPEVEQANTELSIALPESVEKGTPVDATVTVSPAEATGKVSAIVEGEKVEADVVGGTATLPLSFKEAGAQQVTFTFTPDDAERFTEATNSATITVTNPDEVMPDPDENGGDTGDSGDNGDNGDGDQNGGENGGGTDGEDTEPAPSIPDEVSDVTITPGQNVGGEVILGEVERKTATVKDANGKGVTGTLKVLVDGRPAHDAEIAVVGGKASWNMDVFDAGKHTVTLQFFDSKGALKGSKNVEMNVKNVEVDPSNLSSDVSTNEAAQS